MRPEAGLDFSGYGDESGMRDHVVVRPNAATLNGPGAKQRFKCFNHGEYGDTLQRRHRLRRLDQFQVEIRRVELDETLLQPQRGRSGILAKASGSLSRAGLRPVGLARAGLHRPALRWNDGGLV